MAEPIPFTTPLDLENPAPYYMGSEELLGLADAEIRLDSVSLPVHSHVSLPALPLSGPMYCCEQTS